MHDPGRRRVHRRADHHPGRRRPRRPARLDLYAVAGGTDARLAWALDLRAPMLRSLAVVARPAMAWAHDRVVERGLAQFEGHALRGRDLLA